MYKGFIQTTLLLTAIILLTFHGEMIFKYSREEEFQDITCCLFSLLTIYLVKIVFKYLYKHISRFFIKDKKARYLPLRYSSVKFVDQLNDSITFEDSDNEFNETHIKYQDEAKNKYQTFFKRAKYNLLNKDLLMKAFMICDVIGLILIQFMLVRYFHPKAKERIYNLSNMDICIAFSTFSLFKQCFIVFKKKKLSRLIYLSDVICLIIIALFLHYESIPNLYYYFPLDNKLRQKLPSKSLDSVDHASIILLVILSFSLARIHSFYKSLTKITKSILTTVAIILVYSFFFGQKILFERLYDGPFNKQGLLYALLLFYFFQDEAGPAIAVSLLTYRVKINTVYNNTNFPTLYRLATVFFTQLFINTVYLIQRFLDKKHSKANQIIV